MLISSSLTAEHIIACLALDSRCLMACRVHMLISHDLATELAAASLAAKGRRPVVEVIHVLRTGATGSESLKAGLAFGPMLVVVHVFVAITFIPVFIVAACALEHDGLVGLVLVGCYGLNVEVGLPGG